MHEYGEWPFEQHLNGYKKYVEIPKYLEDYLKREYSAYFDLRIYSDGNYECVCGYFIPTPGHSEFILVSDNYQDKKDEILNKNYLGTVCPKCKRVIDFVIPLEYIDLSKKILIRASSYKKVNKYWKNWSNGYKEFIEDRKRTKELRANGYKFYEVSTKDDLINLLAQFS